MISIIKEITKLKASSRKDKIKEMKFTLEVLEKYYEIEEEYKSKIETKIEPLDNLEHLCDSSEEETKEPIVNDGGFLGNRFTYKVYDKCADCNTVRYKHRLIKDHKFK